MFHITAACNRDPAVSSAFRYTEYAPVTDDGPPLDIVIRLMPPAADPREQICSVTGREPSGGVTRESFSEIHLRYVKKKAIKLELYARNITGDGNQYHPLFTIAMPVALNADTLWE